MLFASTFVLACPDPHCAPSEIQVGIVCRPRPLAADSGTSGDLSSGASAAEALDAGTPGGGTTDHGSSSVTGSDGAGSPRAAVAIEASVDEVRIRFSELLDPNTVTSESVRIQRDGQPVAGVVTALNSEIIFTPTARFPLATSYEIRVAPTVHTSRGSSFGELLVRFISPEGSWGVARAAPAKTAPAVTMTSSGNAAVVWAAEAEGSAAWQLTLKTFSATSPAGLTEALTTNATTDGRPMAAMNDAGELAIAWVRGGGVWLATRTAMSPWHEAAYRYGRGIDVALGDPGTGFLVAREMRDPTDQGQWGVRARRFVPGMGFAGSDRTLLATQATDSAGHQEVAVVEDGAVAAWENLEATGSIQSRLFWPREDEIATLSDPAQPAKAPTIAADPNAPPGLPTSSFGSPASNERHCWHEHARVLTAPLRRALVAVGAHAHAQNRLWTLPHARRWPPGGDYTRSGAGRGSEHPLREAKPQIGLAAFSCRTENPYGIARPPTAASGSSASPIASLSCSHLHQAFRSRELGNLGSQESRAKLRRLAASAKPEPQQRAAIAEAQRSERPCSACLGQKVRSIAQGAEPSLALGPLSCGACGTRTYSQRIKNPLLYQLS